MITGGTGPDSWKVGLVKEGGQVEILTESSSTNPSAVEEVIFPLSIPWVDGAPLYNVGSRAVSSEERGSGKAVCHSARMEDRVPNSDDSWAVELELWEYPTNVFNMSRLTRTEHIRVANWDTSDLRNAIESQFL